MSRRDIRSPPSSDQGSGNSGHRGQPEQLHEPQHVHRRPQGHQQGRPSSPRVGPQPQPQQPQQQPYRRHPEQFEASGGRHSPFMAEPMAPGHPYQHHQFPSAGTYGRYQPHMDFGWAEDDDDEFFRGRRAFGDPFGRGFPQPPPPFDMGGFRDGLDDRYQQRYPQRSASPSTGKDGGGGGGGGGGTIPIRVVHERVGPKHPAGQARNHTADIPARGSPVPNGGSPRVERARSEPPKSFPQGQNPYAQPKPPYPDPIPENTAQAGLQVPPNSKIATSASSPSVPASPKASQQGQGNPPPPPPRQHYPDSPNLRKQSAPPGVRHIPIFVEGSDVPVVPNKPRPATAHQGGPPSPPDPPERAFVKPSAFYPEGVRRVPRGAGAGPGGVDRPARPGAIPGFAEAAEAGKRKARDPAELTSPLSPPTGPIPMGCSPSHLNPPGSTVNGPQFPKGPQPASTNEQVDVAEVDMRDAATEPPSHKDEASFQIPVKVVHEQGPQKGQSQQQQQHENRQQSQPKQQQEQQQRSRPSAPHGNEEEPKAKKQLTPEEMAVAKVKKVKEEVASLRERIENFKGKKTDKEYLYLDEMLTRQLLSLDGVETFGKDDIRTMRKESINAINRCLSMLDTKVNKGGVAEGEGEKMEQDSAAAANASEEKSSEPEKMEEDSPVNNTKSNAEVSDSALDQLAAERPPQKQ